MRSWTRTLMSRSRRSLWSSSSTLKASKTARMSSRVAIWPGSALDMMVAVLGLFRRRALQGVTGSKDWSK